MSHDDLLDQATIDRRGQRMLGALAADICRDSPHHLGTLLVRHLVPPFGRDIVAYVSDLQEESLVAYPRDGRPTPTPLLIEGSLAGQCFRRSVPQRGGHIDSIDGSPRANLTTMWLPLLDGSERLGVLAVELDVDDAEHPAVIAWLAHLADVTAGLVMTGQRTSDTVTRLRRSREMDVAAEMQWALLPPLTFEDAHVSISGALEPAYEVAGDTFDYSVEEGVTKFAVFDAVGHGLDSAMLASLTISAYRNARRRGRSLTGCVKDIEQALGRIHPEHRFVTGLVGELSTTTGELRWLSAGHPAPVLMRGTRAVKELEAPAMRPLGMGLGSQSWWVRTEQLEPADRVVLFSDGVTEARTPDGDFFGLDRLVDHVGRHVGAGLTSAEATRRIVHALLEHQQDRLQDDATLLLLQWKPDPRSDRRAA